MRRLTFVHREMERAGVKQYGGQRRRARRARQAGHRGGDAAALKRQRTDKYIFKLWSIRRPARGDPFGVARRCPPHRFMPALPNTPTLVVIEK